MAEEIAVRLKPAKGMIGLNFVLEITRPAADRVTIDVDLEREGAKGINFVTRMKFR